MSRFRSIWQASVNATKKALTWNVDDWIPPAKKYIFNFNAKEELKRWHLYSDSEYGGMQALKTWLSSTSLEITDNKEGSKGIFSGNFSLDFTEDSKWNIKRGGFCGMRSKKFDGFIDLDAYDTIAIKLLLALRNKWFSDNRKITHGRLLFLFPRIADPFGLIFTDLARNVIDARLEINPARMVGMPLSVNAKGGVPGARTGPGDFRVELDWIKAMRTESNM